MKEATPIGGGDLSQVWRVTLGDPDEQAIVKNGPFPRREGAMLQRLADAGAPAPHVLAADDTALVMAQLPADGSLADAWADLGQAMQRYHAAPTAPAQYGWEDDFAFGPLAIPAALNQNWAAFWRDHRLLNHLPHLPTALGSRLERLAQQIETRLPATPRPSLLHGDLWSGNVLACQGRVSGVIDPACLIGHAEADFAILTLFSAPPDTFWSAYGPLEPGAAERLDLYRLWPALVHLRLFGSGYRMMVETLLDNLGA